jgi:hypothetical protein
MPRCLDSTLYNAYASVYYSVLDQNAFGAVDREWVYDKDIMCSVVSAASLTNSKQLSPDIFMKYEDILIFRSPVDITRRSNDLPYPITEILISNIKNKSGDVLFSEGIQEGKIAGTVYEITGIAPVFDAFDKIDHYKIMLARSDNQDAVGVE